MRRPPKVRLEHLPPLLIAAGTAGYLLLHQAGGGEETPVVAALLVAVAVLFVLHSVMALRLQHTVAFLSGLETGYLTLVLVRSASEPLLGLELPAYAAACALLLSPTLILVYGLGASPLLAPRTALRVAAVVGLPLAWAGLLRWHPGAATALLGWRIPGLPWPFALPQLGALLLLPLAAVLLAPRRGRSLHDLCLAASLLPLWILLEQAARHGESGVPIRFAVVFAASLVSLLYGLFRLFWRRAFQDELTGLGNRRSFEEKLRFLRGRFCLAMLDIDHFKAVNDTYGHQEGDNVLRWVAAPIGGVFGARAFRYGGEEFAVILGGGDSSGGSHELDALRRTLADSEFIVRSAGERRRAPRRGSDRRRRPQGRRKSPPHASPGRQPGPRGGIRIRVTISIGLASCDGRAERPQEVLERADRALYRAKREGRNRLVSAGEVGGSQARST
jgi:GGDEF domain-containing protein